MVIIIGAGISGLSAAWHLQKNGIEYRLLEATSFPGGYIKTLRKDGLILELGPNSILCDNELLNFIDEVGASDQMLKANTVSKSRYIMKGGKYRQLPDNPPSLLFSSFFSFKTKFKIFTEPFRKPESKQEETLDSFFTRRFGKEISDYALNPFITGIYAGDPKEILLEETFPTIKEYEATYGSVLKGFIKNKPARRESYNFKTGMATLPEKIAEKLKHLNYNFPVTGIQRSEGKWIVKGINNGNAEELKADIVIITTPAFHTSQLIKEQFPEFSNALNKISYPPMCIVHSVYPRKNINSSLNGFGALNPKVENQFTSGCIWASSVFNGKVPDEYFLFTSFVGGTLNAEKTKLSEEEIKSNVHQELSKYFEISGNPFMQYLVRYDKAIPQYTKSLKEAISFIPAIEDQQLFFSTNWKNGVSISDCIKKGKQLANKIIELTSR